ncbi:hypothetical protein ROLI_042250 [Roseobacter fucihabitans]|uniref:CobQ/CobB/MinD/ParA nucleotide binding domain-containing protein n=1 Tax=Roseobacter fucihabitans TaxID=1537242 RepID=A0ABZ2BYQ2_9RHOB|nr:Chromosome-partitioning ATPase Soj [Roseobacter litoralis]
MTRLRLPNVWASPFTPRDSQKPRLLLREAEKNWPRGGHAPDGKKRLRKFSTWEIWRYLIPVAPAHFRRVLKAQPKLPQGVGEGNSKWFSLDEIIALRKHFATEGAAHREYSLYRPQDLDAKVVAVANFKGGVGKTSTCAHLAMSAALDGYRVLVIDLDSQGSLTRIMGGRLRMNGRHLFRSLRVILQSILLQKTRFERHGAIPR